MVLESARPGLTSLPGIPGRASGQLLLAALMVMAFIAVILARSSSPGPASTVPPASPSVAITASPTPRPTPRPTPSPSVSASAEVSPSASTAAVPSPTSYTVRRGDTLLAIAERFGVTVRALTEANGITDPSLLRVGQTLTIPAA